MVTVTTESPSDGSISVPNSGPLFGIVTALPQEFQAMKVMLDSPSRIRPIQGDPNIYHIGKIESISTKGAHSIVLAQLTGPGNNLSSIAATHLMRSFPSVQHVLMVGIAGGVPHRKKPDKHVRLGDVVVSDRHGVIQYDNIRRRRNGVDIVGISPPPSPYLTAVVRDLEAERFSGQYPWEEHIKRAQHLIGASRPSPATDLLFSSTKSKKVVPHPTDVDRRTGHTRIHYGRIGSANTLLKDPLVRDSLRDALGIRAVEMEGSGVADATWMANVGYMAIRGVCDYCDSHKGQAWQVYAATAAAAYARALIEAY
ncbi:5'-methylthioadenosine/S-adenosylhomocysteine nucleosidase [Streptomyces sp. NBC_00201]|uniref:5'-methylthioadenosine/S-adenosylhomocysteine nucleosidase n=1 Tax=Streptomyces sp. NBC_00201 TaxID=2975679 RepID=UPI0022523854|nr:5'-methylthioadenosine/S-adenosylhomocysteine nucleosidase [Streptomyces sp. NBC_00201]MCX5247832.1 5'-methylthioadenosine/S-adenosylhomocysteine nucleosidase [Streptomyces sp. NBC_00201]